MTKSAVRSMDLVQEFMQKQNISIENFILMGGSKRAWVTYLAAAVDKRVKSIIPVVIPILNTELVFPHIYKSLCEWPKAMQAYKDMKIFERMGTPEFKTLVRNTDPFHFLDRITVPKFVIAATGDQWFPCDTSSFFYPYLKGEKHLWYIPNSNHDLHGKELDVAKNVLAFYTRMIKNLPRPEYSWEYFTNGTLLVKSGAVKPKLVLLWQATNPNARNFMVETIGKVWKSSEVKELNGVWRATITPPAKGWTAFNMELHYEGDPYDMLVSTSTYIIPNVYPACK